MIDLKMLYILILGIFLSVLYYAEELIEEQTYKEKSLWAVSGNSSLVYSNIFSLKGI